MWLYHYQPNPPQILPDKDGIRQYEKDGFAGMVTKGLEFNLIGD